MKHLIPQKKEFTVEFGQLLIRHPREVAETSVFLHSVLHVFENYKVLLLASLWEKFAIRRDYWATNR